MRSVMFCGRKNCGVKITGNLKISPFIKYTNLLHEFYKLKHDTKGYVCLNVVALQLLSEFQ